MAKDLLFDLSPTQSKFVHTDAHIAMLMGPMGEGKTFAGTAGLLRHAQRCGKPIRAALIRDTHQNIKISTVPSLKEILGGFVDFHDDCKQMEVHSDPKVTADLFGIDDPASMSKLQGPEYACIWLEEPAPIIEKANAGLPRDVFDLAIARASRQKGTLLRVQVTQNPADEDHWTEDVANSPGVYEEDVASGMQILKEVYRIAYGENTYLNPLSRLANKAAFRNEPGKYARYVEGRPAAVQKGKRVTPEYNPKIHFAARELPVIPGALGLRFYDGWHHPVCLIAQYIPPGKIWFHNCFWGDGVGIKELLEQQVVPMIMSPKYRGKIADWRDIGDPSMRTGDQSTALESAARRLEGILKTSFEPGPTKWSYRLDPLRSALSMLGPDGSPLIYVSQSAYDLHRALNGGWHFKSDNSGKIIGNLPVKDKAADVGDAAAYGVAKVLPYVRIPNIPTRRANQGIDPMRRAMSYSNTLYGGGGMPARAPAAAAGEPSGITLRNGIA
jgi:hypothetical protein